MQSFNSNCNCIENCAESLHLTTISNSISLWTYKHFNLCVSTFSVLHRKSVSHLKNLENFQFSPPFPPQAPKNNPTKETHKQTRAAFLDSRLMVFSRFYKTSSFFRLVRDRAESQVSLELTTKLQFISVFFCSGWGTYVRDILLSLHDRTVTNTFFLRYKYCHREVL